MCLTMNRDTLQESIIHTCKNHSSKFAFADSSGAKVTYGEALAKSLFLTGRLKPAWEGQEKVGILVPPSVGGALVNWAALLMGKIPVNLNYTLSEEGIASCGLPLAGPGSWARSPEDVHRSTTIDVASPEAAEAPGSCLTH